MPRPVCVGSLHGTLRPMTCAVRDRGRHSVLPIECSKYQSVAFTFGRAPVLLQIVNYPHPALRYASRPVTEIDDDLRATIRAMFELMDAAKGVGLAANQVNLPFRFFVLNVTADPAQSDKELVFINPEIVKRHASVEEEEGCLSLPGLYAPVWRARRIRVQAYDL